MYKRHLRSILWTALYAALSYGISLTGVVLTWQAFVLLAPPAILLVALAWTTPLPDYSAIPDAASPPIENLDNPSRKFMWLNGSWEFRLNEKHRWRRINIPGPWNIIPGLEHFNGAMTFRRVFKIPEGWSQGSVFLNFRGVNYHADVAIDGRIAGSHEGGFTPFSIDITDRLGDGREKELEVDVDNTLTAATVPNVLGWNNDGGILREVYLETRNREYIDDIYVLSTPDLKGRADIALMVKIHNPSLRPIDYRIEILSPQGALVHEHRIEGWTMQTLQHRLKINFVSLWSPDSPMLYRCRVIMDEDSGDQQSIDFGVRSFETDGEDGFLLNGKPFRLRGISRIEESQHFGRTQSLELIRTDIEKIKAAGFNTVRLAAFPAHPETLNICNKIGLLVMEEIPAWNTLLLDLCDPGYQQSAEVQLREMIMRDRNHPCVIMWGLANRIESNSSEARWFVDRLTNLARGMNDRPVYITTSSPHTEICADIVDVVVLQLYGADMISLKADAASARYGSGLIVFHRGASADKPTGTKYAGEPGTEEYQARFNLDYIDHFDQTPDVAGWIVGYLTDYRDPSRIGGSSAFKNVNGLLKKDRTEKLAYTAIKQKLKEGFEPDVPRSKQKPRVTSFTKILASAFLGVCMALIIIFLKYALYFAYDPKMFALRADYPWMAVFFTSVFAAIGIAVIANRYFKMAPRKVLGSIDMPYFIIISFIFRSEITLFFCTYLSLLYLWVFNSSIFHLVAMRESFMEVLNLTSALSLPQCIFLLPAFFGLRLKYTFAIFNIWILYLAYQALGLTGTVVYAIVGPAIFLLIPAAFIEWKFRIRKYIGQMIKARS